MHGLLIINVFQVLTHRIFRSNFGSNSVETTIGHRQTHKIALSLRCVFVSMVQVGDYQAASVHLLARSTNGGESISESKACLYSTGEVFWELLRLVLREFQGS